jgi:nitrilase
VTPTPGRFKVAAVQEAPVFLDRAATVAKACDQIARAAADGAQLVVFPEAFVPAYPDWLWSVPARERGMLNELYAELLEQSVDVPGPVTEALGQAARQAGVHVVIGVNERNAEASGSSLYNTLLFIGPGGSLLGKHRKLVPTASERLLWAPGDGSTFQVFDTSLGKIAGLICWESYMPLARYAAYAWGTQIYVAPTWDRGEPWLATLRHIAREGRVFVIGCCQALRRDDIPDRYDFKRLYPPDRVWINAGDSAIAGPDGNWLAGPLHESQGIIMAEIDVRQALGSRWMFDAAGHYARPDVFELTVKREAHPMVRTIERDRAPELDGKAARMVKRDRPSKRAKSIPKRRARRSS